MATNAKSQQLNFSGLLFSDTRLKMVLNAFREFFVKNHINAQMLACLKDFGITYYAKLFENGYASL